MTRGGSWLKAALMSVAVSIAGIVHGEGAVVPVAQDRPDQVPPKAMTLDLGRGVSLELVLVPAGSFVMGSTKGGGGGETRPVRKVTISRPFYMAKYEVTGEQWAAVMGNNPSAHKGRNLPVQNVNWEDCRNFMARLKESIKGTNSPWTDARLPTEAEWEYACRAGSSNEFSFGNSAGGLGEYAWFAGNSGDAPHAVGGKKPNAWGLYDMHGGVFEWCSDWYGNYGSEAETDPAGPGAGKWRVCRGGSWSDVAECCRSAYRYYDGPGGAGGANIGFRVVLAMPVH